MGRGSIVLSEPPQGKSALKGAAFALAAAGTIAMLLVAHGCIGARMRIDGTAPMGQLEPHEISADNLLSAAEKLHNASSWLMLAVVLGLSGAWPYVKVLVTCLLLFLASRGTTSRSRAHTALTVLEILGKWSMSDIYLATLNSSIFLIQTASYSLAGFGSLQISLTLQLCLAPVLLGLAVLASMLLTSCAKHHLEAEPDFAALTDRRLLADPSLSQKQAESREPSFRVFFAVGGLAALVPGVVLPAISVQRSGFLGRLIGENSEVRVSCVSLAASAAGAGGNSAGGFVLLVFILFTLVVIPIVEMLLLIASGVCASFRVYHASHKCRVAASWCYAFSCIEVYMAICLVLMKELVVGIKFNLGSECDAFKSMMDNKQLLDMVGLGFARSSQCFLVDVRLQSGFWALAAWLACRAAAWRLAFQVPALGEDQAKASSG